MYPTEERIRELRERFGVRNGQFWGTYRFKNLNWYLCDATVVNPEHDEWFCYGDVREEDPERLRLLLRGNELLVMGYKELGPDQRKDEFFGDGHGVWLVIGPNEVHYDCRRDYEKDREERESKRQGQEPSGNR